jgi:hypothetical protein
LLHKGLARHDGSVKDEAEGEQVAEQFEILNTESHRDLRIRADVGAHPHFVMIGINEFPAAASVCPILLAKDPATGEFYAAALFGFQPGEVLVEGANEGNAAFRPLDLQRQGFLTADENIAVDTGHPRFGEGATIALFEADGTPTNALRKIQQALGQLVAGVEATRAFFRELLRLKLIEPIDISLKFDDGQKLSLDGLYTVSRDGLAELDDAEIVALFRKGYLQAALCMTLSLSQIAVLARHRNQRLTAAER